jgi:uncharacterized protein (TIGR00251 family)
MKFTETKDGTIIEIYVKPNSPKFQITFENDEIVVRCTEEPTKSKVNKELVKEFSKLFHAQVEIVSGATSKQKKLLVKDISLNTIEQTLKTELRKTTF